MQINSLRIMESNPLCLGVLPVDHPLRNVPLVSIGAETRWRHGSQWEAVEFHWKIARLSFNDLGDAWVDNWEWRATVVFPGFC